MVTRDSLSAGDRGGAARTPVLAAGQRPLNAAYDADIVILTIGRFAETAEAVNSALRQTGISLHVTVLDQGSTAATRQRFIAAFSGRDNLAYFTINENFGVAGGRNLLAGLGHGNIIVAIDNDAVFENDSVAAGAVAAFAATPALGALAFRILARDGIALDEFSWGYPAPLKSRFADRFDTTTFVGAGHAIRRQTWDQAGGYDPKLFFTWEEYDFCLAAISLQWLVRYDGSLGVIHKVAAEARVGWSATRVRYFVRNRLIIARKWRASWLQLSPRIIGYLVKGVRNRRLRATIAGVIDALRQDADGPARNMTPAMRGYYFRNETRHRGSLWRRLRHEVFARASQDPRT